MACEDSCNETASEDLNTAITAWKADVANCTTNACIIAKAQEFSRRVQEIATQHADCISQCKNLGGISSINYCEEA